MGGVKSGRGQKWAGPKLGAFLRRVFFLSAAFTQVRFSSGPHG